MSFWGRVFGTDEAIAKTVESVGKGIDALVYTDQERETAAAIERAAARGMLVQWMDATKGQNLARRLIALAVTSVWLTQYLATWLMGFVAVFVNTEYQVKLQTAAMITTQQAESMNGPVMLILTFYFAAPHMGKFADAIVGRMAKPKAEV